MVDFIGQIESVVSQKCIGYQRNYDGSMNTVIEEQVKLKIGGIVTCWTISSMGIVTLPLAMKPHIDIPIEQFSR
jgi:hypothetical protein